MTGFRVEITRGDQWGPFAYILFIAPAPRFGSRHKFAWSRAGAEAKARRWIRRAESMGSKQPQDLIVIATIGGES